MKHHLQDTIGNSNWVLKNESRLKALFPSTWTNASTINLLPLGLRLKLFGVPWQSADDIKKIIVFFVRIGLLEHRSGEIRVSEEPLHI